MNGFNTNYFNRAHIKSITNAIQHIVENTTNNNYIDGIIADLQSPNHTRSLVDLAINHDNPHVVIAALQSPHATEEHLDFAKKHENPLVVAQARALSLSMNLSKGNAIVHSAQTSEDDIPRSVVDGLVRAHLDAPILNPKTKRIIPKSQIEDYHNHRMKTNRHKPNGEHGNTDYGRNDNDDL